MKQNKLTPGANLLWESSRMMLPEHREALLEYAQQTKNQPRPNLDEQQLDELNKIIHQAYTSKAKLRLVFLNEYGHTNIYIGRVTSINHQWQRLLLVKDEESKWIAFQDILEAIID